MVRRCGSLVVSSNEQRPRSMARKVSKALDGQVRGKSIAVLGLTFKPNTDDMRDSPAISVIQSLQDMGAVIRAYDPAGMTQARTFLNAVTYSEDAYACAAGADALVIITEWEQFRALDLDRLQQTMAQPIIIDLRNVYRLSDMLKHGFRYLSVGRSPVEGALAQVEGPSMARASEVVARSVA